MNLFLRIALPRLPLGRAAWWLGFGLVVIGMMLEREEPRR